MRKCHLILKQIVNGWNFNSSILVSDVSCVAWGTPVGTCLLSSSLTTPLPLFFLPNYKQGMFVSGSSQVTMALGACLAVKSGLLSAFVIDVSGSEVTQRSNMNMETFELSDGCCALTTSADKINWKLHPMGVRTEHVICFLFFLFIFCLFFWKCSPSSPSHIHAESGNFKRHREIAGYMQSVGQLCILSTSANLTSLFNGSALAAVSLHRTWQQLSFGKERDFSSHTELQALQEKIVLN